LTIRGNRLAIGWLVLHCRGEEVRPILETWAEMEGLFTSTENNSFNIAINVPTGEDFD